LVDIRLGKLQEFGQGRGTGPMHGRTHRHLDGFQIEKARLAVARENDAQQLVYFTRDFFLDCVRRFFSCVVGAASSQGRNRQIFSFTSTNSWPIS
jgi:hypothetical protein